MAVPPTSPHRILPQPVTVDVQDFMPQGDLFQQSMEAYEKGSKLPLLLEEIKHEKKRIKVENSKLDFALSEAGRMQQAEERRRAQMLADAELKKLQYEALEARNKALGSEIVNRGGNNTGSGVSLTSATTTPTTPAPNEEPNVPPLTNESVFDETYGDRMIRSTSEIEVLADAAPPPEESLVYVPKIRTADTINLPALEGEVGSRNVDRYAQMLVREQLRFEFPPFVGPRKDEAEYNQNMRKRMFELQEKYTPVEGVKKFKDTNGLPISLPVIKVGNQIVDIVGPPYLDTDRLTKAHIKRDEEFQKMRDTQKFVSDRVTRDSNLERLMNAAQHLVTAKDSWNPADSRLAAAILPDSVRNLFGSDREKARNEARTVIQQQLRATLGAQFAFKEGEQMLDRSFNLLFDDAHNLGMLKDAAQNIITVSREYDRALKYYDSNQTLAGFSFNSGLVTEHPVLSEFDEAILKFGKEASPKTLTPTDASRNVSIQQTLDRLRNRGPFGTRS